MPASPGPNLNSDALPVPMRNQVFEFVTGRGPIAGAIVGLVCYGRPVVWPADGQLLGQFIVPLIHHLLSGLTAGPTDWSIV